MWEFVVGTRTAPVESSFAGFLDYNGDGYADIAIGQIDQSTRTGALYLYAGGPMGASTSYARIVPPDGVDSLFPLSIASAGDVNGDGFGDLLVSAPGWMNATGHVYLYYGASTGLTDAPTILDGASANSSFGVRVATAGDLNGDGFADVLMSELNTSTLAGQFRVYYGGPAGLSSPPTMRTSPGADAGSFGLALAGGFDFNGDGFSDVIAGASQDQFRIGRAYLYFGGASGLGTTPTVVDGAPTTDSNFGANIAALGDVNGDGFGDIAIAATADLDLGTMTRVRVYSGNSRGAVDAPTTLVDTAPSRSLGGRIASAGDVNGDGYSDMLLDTDDSSGPAGVYLYMGSAGGLTATPMSIAPPPGGGGFGATLGCLRDVNGDGYDDFLVAGRTTLAGVTTEHVFLYQGADRLTIASPRDIGSPLPNPAGFGVTAAVSQ